MTELTDVKNRILAQVPLRQLIGEKVELSRRASLTTGCCPFHEERTPSFVVYDDHYHCYGCRAHGDAITYVRQQQGLSFVEALRFLAEKYQVAAPELDRSRQQNLQLQQRSSLYRAMTAAQEVFTSDLSSPDGQQARQYLLDRGFSPENIAAFGFGLARDDFQFLIEHLGRKGFSPNDLVRCSLATTSERSQRPFTFFRNRLTIPIRDSYGRIIGYGARTLSNEPAKYINSKESDLYDKSRHLFGLDRAKDAIRRKNCAVIVEGYMDTLQLWQNNIPEAVACLGTALTASQLALLANFCNRAILLFDGDAAGTNAMLRTVATAQSVPQLQLLVAVLPEGEDPDSYVRRVGTEGLREFLKTGKDILDFAITKKLQDSHTLGVADVIENELFPWLRQISDPLKRRVLLQRIGKLSGISASGVEEAWTQWARKQNGPSHGQRQQAPKNQTNQLPRTPSRQIPLTARDWELFGHLYFATASEIELHELQSHAASILQLDELHTAFYEELVQCLQDGASPSGRDRGSWGVSADPRILSLIDQLEKKALAFRTNHRNDAVQKIVRSYQFAERTAARAKLRAQLHQADPEQQLKILTAITNLNNEISELEKSNQNQQPTP